MKPDEAAARLRKLADTTLRGALWQGTTTRDDLLAVLAERDSLRARLAAQQPVIDAAVDLVRMLELPDLKAGPRGFRLVDAVGTYLAALSARVEAGAVSHNERTADEHVRDHADDGHDDEVGSLTGDCCSMMRDQSTLDCGTHDDPRECPDVLVLHGPQGPGLPVRDGSPSWVAIRYCPWCATDLCAVEAPEAWAECVAPSWLDPRALRPALDIAGATEPDDDDRAELGAALYTRLGLLRVEAESEVERMQAVIRNYVNHIESGDAFGALVSLVPGLVDDTGQYGAVES